MAAARISGLRPLADGTDRCWVHCSGSGTGFGVGDFAGAGTCATGSGTGGGATGGGAVSGGAMGGGATGGVGAAGAGAMRCPQCLQNGFPAAVSLPHEGQGVSAAAASADAGTCAAGMAAIGAAAIARGTPQLRQNAFWPPLAVPHAAHSHAALARGKIEAGASAPSGAPQLLQNRAPAAFSCPHLAHRIATPVDDQCLVGRSCDRFGDVANEVEDG